ncbi:MAG: hypothetical protein R3A51_22200 [Nannocystaceae bacterium]|nr:hypothetical protein [Myxococcales bacterium]
MTAEAKPVTRLYPFALRARVFVVGKPALRAARKRLHCVLVTEDLGADARAAVIEEFGHVPVVAAHHSQDSGDLFGKPGAKIIGILKSTLARSIYAELRHARIHKPPGAAPPQKRST